MSAGAHLTRGVEGEALHKNPPTQPWSRQRMTSAQPKLNHAHKEMMMSITTADRAYAATLDADDPLAELRNAFHIADPDLIYLDGNSLGRLPRATQSLVNAITTQQWGERLIRGWNEHWFYLPEQIGAKIAALIGADADEVIVADSTSINLFKLALAALKAQPGRTRIVSDDLNFPSDLYVLQGAVELLNAAHQLLIIPSADGIHGPIGAIEQALDQQTALLSLSHVVFKSGYRYDMAALTAAAHAVGALTLWDLSHSVGAVPIDLHAANVDLAVGCCYKFLNGGPGAPAFLYVRRDLQAQLRNPLTGWMGRHDLFGFALNYTAAEGIRRFLTGTPPIVALALIEPGVDLMLQAGMDRLYAKAVAQSRYLIDLWQRHLAPLGYTLNSPPNAAQRGSHISLGHPDGLAIDLALIADLAVLPDFRQPDNIRLGIAPIYTRYQDILTAVERLIEAIRGEHYLRYRDRLPTVT